MPEPEERAGNIDGWLGNARIYERSRRECLDMANGAEENGNLEAATSLRDSAAAYRRLRDAAQRSEETRALNRRVRRRRNY